MLVLSLVGNLRLSDGRLVYLLSDRDKLRCRVFAKIRLFLLLEGLLHQTISMVVANSLHVFHCIELCL